MHDAKLIWITPDAEKLVGKIARVSNPNNEDNPDVSKLLKYLIKHKHWSPFEMASMCVEIKTTRAIAPQILRHRSFSFQEFSQRYAIPTESFPTVIPDLRRQDTKNRQNSIEGVKLYESLLHSDVAKECVRSVLPLNTCTRLYMSGTLRSWLHYVDLRGSNGTQLEHMSIADSVREILEIQVPTIARAMWE